MTEQIKPLTESRPADRTKTGGFGSYLHKVLAIVAKDVAMELRTKEMVSAMFVFSLLVILIFNFAFDLRAENQQTVAPGVLWWAWEVSGTRLFRAVVGVRRIACTADHLELGRTRVALRRITHCERTIDGLLLRTIDGERSVRLAAPDPSQLDWLASAVRAAAEQARRTPLPPHPPEELSRLRRS